MIKKCWTTLQEQEPPFHQPVRVVLKDRTERIVVRQKTSGKGDGKPSVYLELNENPHELSSNKDYRPLILGWRWNERNKDSTINHPAHYGGEGNPYECIKVLEEWLSSEELEGALKFNIFKYLKRYPHKNGLQNLYKAQWYLDQLIKHLENLTDEPSNDHD